MRRVIEKSSSSFSRRKYVARSTTESKSTNVEATQKRNAINGRWAFMATNKTHESDILRSEQCRKL